jgi:tetratricopeptide (TPR) repeat protein
VNFGKQSVSNIDLGPGEDPIKLNNEGVKYYNKGKYKTALNYFNRAISIAPQFDMARENRVFCIQMLREKHAQKLKQKAQKAIKTSKIRTRASYKPPVRKKSMDYRRQRYSEFDKYGQIPSSGKSNVRHHDYMNEFGWRQSRWR